MQQIVVWLLILTRRRKCFLVRCPSPAQMCCLKASSRLYFLKQLKRAALAAAQLRHFSLSAIGPILEYCSIVWHHGLTKTQVEQLEAVHRRAIRIIFEVTSHMPNQLTMVCANISSLHARREDINKKIERFWINLTILCAIYYHHPVTLLL